MTRPRSAALLAALAIALLVAACGGKAPAGPVLTDPTAIVTAALTSAQAAKSVHVDATVDGVVPVTLPGASSSTDVNLTGTTANADVDLTAGEMRATFAVPAMLGLAGELIQADGTTYLKTTLTGSKFKVVDGLGACCGSIRPIRAASSATSATSCSSRASTRSRARTSACGGTQCYTVVVDLDCRRARRPARRWGDGLPVDVAGSTLKMTVRVEQTLPNHLAGLSIVLGLPSGQTVDIEATFSKWDEGVTIEAPAADEISS